MHDDEKVDVLLTYQAAAERLSMPLRSFRRLVDEGKLPSVRLRERTPRIRTSDLVRYVDSVTMRFGANPR